MCVHTLTTQDLHGSFFSKEFAANGGINCFLALGHVYILLRSPKVLNCMNVMVFHFLTEAGIL
jgi:hypothetical protein